MKNAWKQIENWIKTREIEIDESTLQLTLFGFFVMLFMGVLYFTSPLAMANNFPTDSISKDMTAASSILGFLDTALFKWGSRLFSGLCVLSAGWALKEQKFGVAVVCIVGAMIIGFSPTFVKNIFKSSGSTGVFSYTQPIDPKTRTA